jgi:hypothetical protein
MKIDTSQVETNVQRTAVTSSSTTIKIDSARIAAQVAANADAAEPDLNAQQDDVLLSDSLQMMLEQSEREQADFQQMINAKLSSASGLFDLSKTPQTQDELGLSLLLKAIEKMNGKRYQARKVELPESLLRAQSAASGQSLNASMSLTAPRGAGLSLSATIETHHYEAESVSFAAKGQVQTADGQTIAFDVELSMSREYASSEKISIEANLADPLVVNYGGVAASLTTDRFSFDLTGDGNAEQIAFAGEGSGFLALDKNGDGTINDGTELFGPQSGDGFADLRAYDEDGNGWIDEGDGVYGDLLVWARDGFGNDTLYSLKELDIGAINLQNASTEFTIGNSSDAQGVVRSTGVFLKDSGGAGTIQHIDLTT